MKKYFTELNASNKPRFYNWEEIYNSLTIWKICFLSLELVASSQMKWYLKSQSLK